MANYVQQSANNQDTGGAVTSFNTNPFGSPTTPGNQILVYVYNRASFSDNSTGCTDTDGNTYVRIASLPSNDSNNHGAVGLWFCANARGGGAGNTATITFSPASQMNVMHIEWSGLGAFDNSGFGNAPGGAGVRTTATCPAAAAGETLISFAEFQGGGSNYHSATLTIDASPNNVLICSGHQTTVAGSNTFSWDADTQFGQFGIIGLTFAAPGGGRMMAGKGG